MSKLEKRIARMRATERLVARKYGLPMPGAHYVELNALLRVREVGGR